MQIGLQVIDQLEQLHKCGFVHYDLKPDNILLSSRNVKSYSSSEIILIDFGFSQEFLSDYGKHCECSTADFNGNFLFQSPNAFEFKKLSRRDDLISLASILAFFFIGEVPWAKELEYDDDLFKNVQRIKSEQTPEKICCGEATALLPFAREVYSYRFEDEPHYGKLK